RSRSVADERRVEIRLTERGAALREQATCIPAEMLSATGLSLEELTALRETLRRMTAALTSYIGQE
ncbi:MarR family transcriptional regulator, partial [Nocardia gipuzkoensis]